MNLMVDLEIVQEFSSYRLPDYGLYASPIR
jgi:hypothetical protein